MEIICCLIFLLSPQHSMTMMYRAQTNTMGWRMQRRISHLKIIAAPPAQEQRDATASLTDIFH